LGRARYHRLRFHALRISTVINVEKGMCGRTKYQLIEVAGRIEVSSVFSGQRVAHPGVSVELFLTMLIFMTEIIARLRLPTTAK